LPKCNVKFGDSDLYLCTNGIQQFVAWYNNQTKVWVISHHNANNDSVQVDFYRPLPKMPKK
jgi:hypothetical protein